MTAGPVGDTVTDSASGMAPDLDRVTGSAAHARKHVLRRRLVLAGSTTPELVHFAGGWLFDQAMAGWDVTVLVADGHDTRALEILGARCIDLESALASQIRGPRPDVLAVEIGLYGRAAVRRGVQAVVEQGTDVRLWGPEWPTSLDARFAVTRHTLTAAAKAFKAQALLAAAADYAVTAIEDFRARPSVPVPA